jgi:hypothetical protein
MKTSYIVVGEKHGSTYYVQVPDVILMKPDDFVCYLYMESQDYGLTEKAITFKLRRRQEPISGYTPEQINNYDILVTRLTDDIQEAEEYANEAKHWSEVATEAAQGFVIDSTPTSGSQHSVSSGGVYTALQGKASTSALGDKADKADTVLTTTLSRGRGASPATGTGSFAFGNNVAATNDYSFATGYNTRATGRWSTAIGNSTAAIGDCSYAEGSDQNTTVYLTGAANSTTYTVSNYSASTYITAGCAITSYDNYNGKFTKVTGVSINGSDCTIFVESTLSNTAISNAQYMVVHAASGHSSHREGYFTTAYGNYSHAEGQGTIAASPAQHVEGKYNIPDPNGVFAHIVGNGSVSSPSNAHWLDWNGNAGFAGVVSAGADPVSVSDLTTKRYVDEVRSGIGKNGLYRGKNLGTVTSSNIDSFVSTHEIYTGKFTDLYLGDYFTLQDGTYNIEWMIAGFDWGYNMGTSSMYVTDHAICVIPRGNGVLTAAYNDTDTTDNGYIYSKLHADIIGGDQGLVNHFTNNVLGNHLVNGLLSGVSATSGGTPTRMFFGIGPMVLPMQSELFGTSNIPLYISNAGVNDRYSIGKLPVFNFISPNMFSNGTFWINGVFDATDYLCTRDRGCFSHHAAASETHWVRPKMYIG